MSDEIDRVWVKNPAVIPDERGRPMAFVSARIVGVERFGDGLDIAFT